MPNVMETDKNRCTTQKVNIMRLHACTVHSAYMELDIVIEYVIWNREHHEHEYRKSNLSDWISAKAIFADAE